MSKLKILLLSKSLVFLIGLMIPKVVWSQPTQSSTSVNNPPCYTHTTDGRIIDLSHLCNKTSSNEVQLANISKAAISAENQALVNNEIEPKRRKILETHGLRYTGFQTDLKVKDIQVQGNQSTVEATEHTVLQLQVGAGDPRAPKTTECYQDRRLSFNLQNGQWKLSSNQILNAPSPQPAEKDVPPIDKSIRPTSINGSQSKDDKRDNLVAEAGERFKGLSSIKYDYTSPTASRKIDLDSQLIATASLNRSAIVDYAYKYWDNYNTNYRSFKQDCTNFVSQAVNAGGWPMVSGWYRSNSAWWYNWLTQSRPWSYAPSWFYFTKDRPRASIATYIQDLEPGDILQADVNGDGTIDHAMIVTKKDSSKTPYLTYHTNNTKDKSFWDFHSSSSNPVYYGWRLFSSYN